MKKLIATLQSHVNPFDYDNSDVINLVTKAVMPNEIKADLCDIDSKSSKELSPFTEERHKIKRCKFMGTTEKSWVEDMERFSNENKRENW